MPRTLIAENGATYIVGSTDTVKLAKRVMETGRVIAKALPKGYVSTSTIGLLLALYLAEEDSLYFTLNDLAQAEGESVSIVSRWIDAFRQTGLVELHNGLLALTEIGYATVIETLQEIFRAQRLLD